MRRPPQRLGPLILERELGAGGMGSVWLAHHVESGGAYALKILPQDADAELCERFRREGEAMGRVASHPHLTQVHSLIEDQGFLGLVLELCTGGDLARRLRAGPLPPAEARAVVSALASGLEVAHAAGILHRDLKPANVVFDEENRPKLTDFGLAKLQDRQSLTQSGALMGTPAYMAPEQAASGTSDRRGDVYGLGGVLYHCLAGRPPFQGATAMSTLDKVLHDAPAPLPATVPPDLRAICLRALAKDPAERYQSASALHEALEAEPQRPGPGRSLLVGGAVFALALCIGALAHAAKRAGPPQTASPLALAASRVPSVTPVAPVVPVAPTRPLLKVPGYLPWPESPPKSLDRTRLLRGLDHLASRESLLLPALVARSRSWPGRPHARLANLSEGTREVWKPALRIRALEVGAPSLSELGSHMLGLHAGDGFCTEANSFELFLLGLLASGDPHAATALESFYKRRGGTPSARPQAACAGDALAWQEAGARAAELLEAPLDIEELRLPVLGTGRVFLFRTLLAELAPQSPFLFEVGLATEGSDEPLAQILEAALGAPDPDPRLSYVAACGGSSRAMARLGQTLLGREEPHDKSLGRALVLLAYVGSDRRGEDRLPDSPGLLEAAGLRAPGADPELSLERARGCLAEVGLLGGPHGAPQPATLPAQRPPPSRSSLVRPLIFEFMPHAPVLLALYREHLSGKVTGARGEQARLLRLALRDHGISGLKRLVLSLGRPESRYQDPLLALRLSLRLVAQGHRGTCMSAYELVERAGLPNLARLQSACLGLSAEMDSVEQAHGVRGTARRELEILPIGPAWTILSELDQALSKRPFARATRRLGPPEALSVDEAMRRMASSFRALRMLRRAAEPLYADPEQTIAKLNKRIARVEGHSDEGLRARGVRRILVAAARRGDVPSLSRLIRLPNVSLPTQRGLIQALLSCESGPVTDRASWKEAIKILPDLGFEGLARILIGLQDSPKDVHFWRAFYRERERAWADLGIPSFPELGPWGIPLELIEERD